MAGFEVDWQERIRFGMADNLTQSIVAEYKMGLPSQNWRVKQMDYMAIEWNRHYGDVGKTRPKKKLADRRTPLGAILMDDDMMNQTLGHAADAASAAHVEHAVPVEIAERVVIAENVAHVGAVDMVNAEKILAGGAVGEALEGSTKTQ